MEPRRVGPLYAVTLLAFVHILLRPSTGYVSNTSVSPPNVVGLFVAFALFSFAFWGYFRFRAVGGEPPMDAVGGEPPVDAVGGEPPVDAVGGEPPVDTAPVSRRTAHG